MKTVLNLLLLAFYSLSVFFFHTKVPSLFDVFLFDEVAESIYYNKLPTLPCALQPYVMRTEYAQNLAAKELAVTCTCEWIMCDMRTYLR